MTLNEIQNYFYKNPVKGHAVVNLLEKDNTLVLTIAPWPDISGTPDITRKKIITFKNVTHFLKYIDKDEEDLNLPWRIIGIDADKLTETHYRFFITSTLLELIVECDWPIIS